MSTPPQNPITRQPPADLRRRAMLAANGVVGASIIATLAVASVFAPALFSGVTLASCLVWLGGLGGNALAGWLTAWAEHNLALFDGDDPEREQKLIVQLARDLHAAMAQSDAIRADVGTVIAQSDAIQLALDALQGQGDQQARLLQLLLEDVQRVSVNNDRLHAHTANAVAASAQRLLDAQAQGDGVLAAQLREILASVQAIVATPTASQTITNQASNQGAQGTFHAPVTFNQQGSTTIGGNVGTYQKIDVSGGTVGSIIGSQHTYGASAPAPGVPPSQDDIDDAADALEIKRKELANASRRAARGISEAAPQVAQARAEIRRLKAQLRAWGQAVADAPGDEG